MVVSAPCTQIVSHVIDVMRTRYSLKYSVLPYDSGRM